MSKKNIIDLSKMNLSYEEKNQTIKLLNLMNIDVAIYKKEKFIENSTKAFAHIPKKLKAKLNPLAK